MENLKEIDNKLNNENIVKANKKNIIKDFTPDLYSKIVSIYNELVRKYSFKENTNINNNNEVLGKNIINKEKKIEDIYLDKVERLHELKISSYKDNIEKNKVTQDKYKLVEMINLEKDICNLKKLNNNIDTSIEDKYEIEEDKYETFILDNFEEDIKDVQKQNFKLDSIENKMLDLNKKLKLNTIDMVEYNERFGKLEEEKVDVVWGLTILNPSLLKEKHIQDTENRKFMVKELGTNALDKFKNIKEKLTKSPNVKTMDILSRNLDNEIEETNNSNLSIQNSEEKVLKDLDERIAKLPIDSRERIRLEAMRNIKRIDMHQAKDLNNVSNKQMDEKNLDKEEVEETTITKTTTITRTITQIEEQNEFIVYLQSKVKVNQDPQNIIEVANAQILRDRTRNDSRQIDILVR